MENIKRNEINEINQPELLSFQKDNQKSFFDLKDNKWQFWGDLPVEESAKLFFETLASYMPRYFKLDEFKKDHNRS